MALPSPETEQHVPLFSADEQHRLVRKIDEVAPHDDFIQSGTSPHGRPKLLHCGSLPAEQCDYISIWVSGGVVFFIMAGSDAMKD